MKPLNILLAILLASITPFAQTARTPRIVVGPNVLVSRDIDLTHWELSIDAAPWDPAVLIGAGSVETHIGRQQAIYVSHDGGAKWSGYIAGTIADPQVAAGVTDGTLFFFGMRAAVKKNVVSRSVDGGRNWGAFQDLVYSDHPMVAVDRTRSRFRGYVYMHGFGCTKEGEVRRKGWSLCLFRSTDEGKTWDDPVVYEHNDTVGRNTTEPVIFSDGTLLLPYADFNFWAKSSPHLRAAWFVASTDGGSTFSSAVKVHEFKVPRGGYVSEQPSFGVDRSARHPERLYMAWRDPTILDGRNFVISSDDKGLTWSKPVPIDPRSPAKSLQHETDLVVNKDGVVGVRWMDTRHGDQYAWDEYFTASLDGGKTFLPAVRVSTRTSRFVRGQSEAIWQTDRDDGFPTELGDSVLIAMGGRGGAGDYLGMTADAHGVFHPIWIDKRDGKSRIYTAAIRVETGVIPETIVRRPAPVVRELFNIVYEPIRYDSAAGVLEVPIRIRNISTDPLYAPLELTVNVAPWSNGMIKRALTILPSKHMSKPATSFADSGSTAAYTLRPLLQDGTQLLPGERTGLLVIRMRAPNRTAGGMLTFSLTAGVR